MAEGALSNRHRSALPNHHVHWFVSTPPKFSPAEIVHYFKGITSKRLKQEFAYLRRQY